MAAVSSSPSNWQKFIRIFNENPLFTWTSIWVLFGLFLGVFVVHLYAAPCNFNYGIVVIWAFAYFLLGALIGCIFGVPKSVSTPDKKATSINTDPNVAIKKNIEIKDVPTNLTEVSDWLTKIVIGAGLVQLNKIPHYVLKVADRMAIGIDITGKLHIEILCAGIIVYYICFGLISGYFIMRTIFLKVM